FADLSRIPVDASVEQARTEIVGPVRHAENEGATTNNRYANVAVVSWHKLLRVEIPVLDFRIDGPTVRMRPGEDLRRAPQPAQPAAQARRRAVSQGHDAGSEQLVDIKPRLVAVAHKVHVAGLKPAGQLDDERIPGCSAKLHCLLACPENFGCRH